jgi:hypothetical protein
VTGYTLDDDDDDDDDDDADGRGRRGRASSPVAVAHSDGPRAPGAADVRNSRRKDRVRGYRMYTMEFL